jgi:Fe-S-cluster-containing dehydrogenase component
MVQRRNNVTNLPQPSDGPKLGLVIDLDICVGCHACAVNCKEWNSGGHSAPMTDWNTYSGTETSQGEDAGAWGVWFNRVHTYEVGEASESRTVHFPRSCLHCEEPACVTVCPTGASYKREEDGIVLVNPDTCIGCKLCSWACPYGAREYDQTDGVMKKCTLCIDKIYNENLEEIDRVPACVSTCPVGARHFGDLNNPQSDVSILVKERQGYDLMPELGYKPTNKYLPPRPRRDQQEVGVEELSILDLAKNQGIEEAININNPLLRWVDTILSR